MPTSARAPTPHPRWSRWPAGDAGVGLRVWDQLPAPAPQPFTSQLASRSFPTEPNQPSFTLVCQAPCTGVRGQRHCVSAAPQVGGQAAGAGQAPRGAEGAAGAAAV